MYSRASERRSQVLVLVGKMNSSRLTGEALHSIAHHQPHLVVTQNLAVKLPLSQPQHCPQVGINAYDMYLPEA